MKARMSASFFKKCSSWNSSRIAFQDCFSDRWGRTSLPVSSRLFNCKFSSSNTNSDKKFIKGVNVLLLDEANRVLLGQRKNSIDAGSWGAPGGHLEEGETPGDGAIREAKEETGLDLTNAELLTSVRGKFKNTNVYYLSYFVLGFYKAGEHAKALEPNKCDEWRWFSWAELPQPLFEPIRNLLDQQPDFGNKLNRLGENSNSAKP